MAASRAEQARNSAVRILKIAEMHAMRRTHGDAGGIQSFLHAVHAEGAFIRITLRMDEACIVRTRRHAGFSADAGFMMNEHHAAALMNMACACRAAVNTRRIPAMVAPLAADLREKRGESASRIIGYPVAIEAFRDLVFGFAGNHAIHASHTLSRIDDHSVTRHDSVSSGSNITKFTFMPVPPIRGSVAYCVISRASLAPFPKACRSPFDVWPKPWIM
jgi:hypothetical protein